MIKRITTPEAYCNTPSISLFLPPFISLSLPPSISLSLPPSISLFFSLDPSISLSLSCDADPAALAKYVVALLRKDKPKSALKELCIDQLEVFLSKGKGGGERSEVESRGDGVKEKKKMNGRIN